MGIKLDMLFSTCVLSMLHCRIRWDENSFIKLKILHEKYLDVLMHGSNENIE